MSSKLLMPKATAVWLVDNTSLTFKQIADFCDLHHLEVKSIADGDSGQGINPLDPILTGQLTKEAIEEAQANPEQELKLAPPKVELPETKTRSHRYTPISRRQDRPSAILWLLRNHPELKDAQIIRLVSTTKGTVMAIKERRHWNISQLQPLDPVTLGLCSQIELDKEVTRSAKSKAKANKATDETLLSPAETQELPQESVAAEAAVAPTSNVTSKQEALKTFDQIAKASLTNNNDTGNNTGNEFSIENN